MKLKWIKIVFAVSALWDGLLAITFLFFSPAIYDYFRISHPNHFGYIHFPVLLMIVFALLYWRVATDPVKFRELIPYGMGLKVSYCAVVFYHQATGGIPPMWISFAWFDIFSLFLFFVAWRTVKKLSMLP
jgi:hypothetical protein